MHLPRKEHIQNFERGCWPLEAASYTSRPKPAALWAQRCRGPFRRSKTRRVPFGLLGSFDKLGYYSRVFAMERPHISETRDIRYLRDQAAMGVAPAW